MKKRIMTTVLGLSMAFTLIACGQNTAGNTPAPAAETTEKTASEATEIAAETQQEETAEASTQEAAAESASEDEKVTETDYTVAVDTSVADNAAVEAYAKTVKDAVLAEDVDWIVENARYPFYLAGEEIADADALRAALEAENSVIKGAAFKEKLESDGTTDMFSNYQGVMIGDDGEIWFGEYMGALSIFTINGV